MVEFYPPIEPHESGMLDVGDGNQVYWECSGNPDGAPVLVVHGGPGSGASPWLRRGLDPDRCRIIVFDQRGCGRSVPGAAEHTTDLGRNTTAHLLVDMERLREHLRVERWLLSGGSWGSTLSLAYAQRQPERVTGLVLVAVTTTRRAEIDWLYRGVGRFFPAQWEEFRAGVPAADRDGDLVPAYARLLSHADPEVRRRAAQAWCAWESAVLSLEPGNRPSPYDDLPEPRRLAFARICAHYMAHGAWFAGDELLRGAGRLAGIPGVLVHGRLDLSSPPDTAWRLARAWPDATLRLVADAGHKATDTLRAHLLRAHAELLGYPAPG